MVDPTSAQTPSRRLSSAAVVEAAAELADEPGPAGLTLAAVAQRVGVRTPSLYKHIGGLDDLRRRLALRGLAELTARLQATAVGLAGDDALFAFAHAYRDYAARHPGRYHAVQRAPDPADAEHERAGAALVEVVLAVLRGYGLEGDAALHATRILRSALHGFVTLEAAGGFGLPLSTHDSFDRLLAVVAAGMHASGANQHASGRTGAHTQ